MKVFAGLLLPVAPALFRGFTVYRAWPRRRQELYATGLALLLVAVFGALGARAWRNLQEPPQWDFGAIRLYAEVAAAELARFGRRRGHLAGLRARPG
jgi:hypothetical protein